MPLKLRHLIAFFVEFERELYHFAPPGVMESKPRSIEAIIKLFKAYANCEFSLKSIDFSEGMPPFDQQNENDEVYPEELASVLFLTRKNAESVPSEALICVNTMKIRGREKLHYNYCYQRFLALKEAYHVILRLEFSKLSSSVHPDTGSPEALINAVEALVYQPFAIVDFDSPYYTDGEKVENAAELFAFLTLYPLESIASDRKQFLSLVKKAGDMTDPRLMASNTYYYADQHKVPQRYVDQLFRWHRFGRLLSTYKKLKQHR